MHKMSAFSKKYCYHSPTQVLTIDGVNYHGADAEGVHSFRGELVVNLTSTPDTPSAAKIPELAPHMDITFKEIMVCWPDFDLPRVKPSFWKALHKYIVDQGYRNVCIHCAGGHGRTGTALSCLAIANLGFPFIKALKRVREGYCDQAVESAKQGRYLAVMDYHYNKRPIPAELGGEPLESKKPEMGSLYDPKTDVSNI